MTTDVILIGDSIIAVMIVAMIAVTIDTVMIVTVMIATATIENVSARMIETASERTSGHDLNTITLRLKLKFHARSVNLFRPVFD